MQALNDFLTMGGYAAFIWPAFGITGVVLAGLWLISGASWRSSEQTLNALQAGRRQRSAKEQTDA